MDRENTFHLPARAIPVRTSSRSPEKGDNTSKKRLLDLKSERSTCNHEAKEKRKKLKLASSFDITYWALRRDIAEKELQATRLTKQISITSMKDKTKDNTKAFLKSEAGQKVMLQEESLKLDSRLFRKQAERMGSKENRFGVNKSFLELFIGAEAGLGIKNSRGQRDNSLQSAFRSDLILKMGSRHPVKGVPDLWCPIRRSCDERLCSSWPSVPVEER